jgi:hypothetical protein
MFAFNDRTYPVELTSNKSILTYINAHRIAGYSTHQALGIYQNAFRQLVTQVKDSWGIAEKDFARQVDTKSYLFGPHEAALVGGDRILIVKHQMAIRGREGATITTSDMFERHVWYQLDEDGRIHDALIPERDFVDHPEENEDAPVSG